MILEVPWDGLWTLSFGLSQFHGHGSWLMSEVALRYMTPHGHRTFKGLDLGIVRVLEAHLKVVRWIIEIE